MPELVAAGVDDPGGWWVVTPFHSGSTLPAPPAPDEVIDGLARLHAHFRGRTVPHVPVVNTEWWLDLVTSWVRPEIDAQRHRHPRDIQRRIDRTLAAVLHHPAVPEVLAALPTTLLHGDVHPGNILTGREPPLLVDWGSARIGPAMLDLAGITTPGTRQLDLYRQVHQERTGTPFDESEVDLGFRWAALQLPVQYLPWVVGHTSTADVIAALQRIDDALVGLDRTTQASDPPGP